jgi:hypothetical protein
MIQSRPERHEFHASAGWVELFMKRKGITLLKANTNTTTLPADAAVRVQVFRDEVAGTIDRFDIEMRVVFNMDETFAVFEYRPLYTANDKGAKSIDVRTSRSNTKLGCTVTLCIAATGEKLLAHITFPRRGFVHMLEALLEEDLPANVRVTSSATGWMKQETVHHWADEVLEPYVTELHPNQFMLILDRYRVHLTDDFGRVRSGRMYVHCAAP